MEYSSSIAARAAYVSNSSVTATGGTITEVDGYRIHSFTSNGTFTIDVATNVEVLVVAGGGGGGYGEGGYGMGGGGAGGLIYKSSFVVTAQAYTVTVGAGGAGGIYSVPTAAVSGGNSVFGSITAIGGGAGAGSLSAVVNGTNGGSGGGGGGFATNPGGSGGSETTGQGNRGGNGGNSADADGYKGGGGGGAGLRGQDATEASATAGCNGGAGLELSISGSSIYYAGGGGSGVIWSGWVNAMTGGSGGAGGGGAGGDSSQTPTQVTTNGTDATPNTGGGGGGAAYQADFGGAGGSGIVIVRYPSPVLSYSEASIKTQGSYAIKSTAPVTTSLNKTLIRTVSPTINLSDKGPIKFDMRATRTGSNIKIGIHDSGGTTTEITPNITSANTYQTVTWDISGVSNANKDAIDQIIITIVNADASNTFYIDNFYAKNYPNNPTALGQRRSDDDEPIAFNTWTNNLTPKATFYLSDDDAGDNVKYRIQVSTKSDFSVNLIAHTSVELPQGTTNYIMTGLSSGSSYYWRVMTIDTYTYTSGWSTANAGDIAVKIDTQPPTGVSVSAFSALSYSQIKVWAAAEDSESGLASAPYFVEMSTAQDFSGNVNDSGWIAGSDYTFSSLTRNKQYYFRLKAKDNLDNTSAYSSVVSRRTQPGTFQEKTTTRTGKNSYGFEGDGIWTWEVPANGGSAVTITAYARYNSDYGGGAKPKITLSNMGVNSSDQMTGGAGVWEKLTVSGTPSEKGVLFLKVEGFSTAVDAKYFVDDIQISQP